MVLKIKELREEFQITQKELADKIGNVQRNISNWENGTSEPDCETLVRLADVFGVTLDELFGRNVSPTPQTGNDEHSFSRLMRRMDDEQTAAFKNFINVFCK